MRKLLIAGGAVALVALVVIGLSQTGGDTGPPSKDALRFTPVEIKERLAGSPAPLAALHGESSKILGGGRDAVRDRLRALRGTPDAARIAGGRG